VRAGWISPARTGSAAPLPCTAFPTKTDTAVVDAHELLAQLGQLGEFVDDARSGNDAPGIDTKAPKQRVTGS
jgi:hypothetical protein